MKKVLIIVLAILLLIGLSSADHTMLPVPETQGIDISTTIDMIGNFDSSSDVQWLITNDYAGLDGIPPLNIQDIHYVSLGSKIYESVYSEETQSNGVGLVTYDKELDIETSEQLSGQWNIEAVKELGFVGVDGARVISSDTIMVDGVAWADWTDMNELCVFAEDISEALGSYCNRAEAGSMIDMSVANVRTTSTDRFVRPAGDYTVELNHDIQVTELITDMPSTGIASAYMDVLIQEAYGGDSHAGEYPYIYMVNGERIEFSESTTFDGEISLFEKLMHYESGMVR